MAQKSKPNRSVRLIREALGKTQTQFGKLLGISGSYVQGIELGDREVTEELADKMRAKFGVSQTDVVLGDRIPKVTSSVRGKTLKERIANYQSASSLDELDSLQILREYVEPKLNVLFEAVGRQKQGFAFCYALDKWMSEVEERLGLRYERERILEERKLRGEDVEWERTVFLI